MYLLQSPSGTSQSSPQGEHGKMTPVGHLLQGMERREPGDQGHGMERFGRAHRLHDHHRICQQNGSGVDHERKTASIGGAES